MTNLCYYAGPILLDLEGEPRLETPIWIDLGNEDCLPRLRLSVDL